MLENTSEQCLGEGIGGEKVPSNTKTVLQSHHVVWSSGSHEAIAYIGCQAPPKMQQKDLTDRRPLRNRCRSKPMNECAGPCPQDVVRSGGFHQHRPSHHDQQPTVSGHIRCASKCTDRNCRHVSMSWPTCDLRWPTDASQVSVWSPMRTPLDGHHPDAYHLQGDF